MRYLLFALSILLFPVIPVHAQIGIGIGLPGISIGINVPVYPRLVPIPGYPVYYDPQATSNYFFYDGLYWVFWEDNWYASSWYNGPWQLVAPEYVPLFVLRIPVRYYHRPPGYFRGWHADAPPHWGEHWGRGWEERRHGWNRWDRRSAPPAAPLPTYQRQYSGERYPRAAEQQHSIQSRNYRYQPREAITQQHFQQQGKPGRSRAEPQRHGPVQQRSPTQQQYLQPNQQLQPMQPHSPQPMQQRQSTQLPPQMQHLQTEPQDKGRMHTSPRDKDRKKKDAPKDRERQSEERGQDRR